MLVILLGGAIAFFADWLGRTLGKKRLHLGRIRPRHVAAGATVIAGILIPLITVLVVSAASVDVRRWILEGRAAIREARELRQLRDSLREEIAKQQAELSERQAQLESQRKELASVQAERDKLVAQTAELQGRLDSLQGTIRDLNGRLASLRGTLADLRGDIETAERDLVVARRNFETQQANNRDLIQRNIALEQENLRFEREVDRLQTQIGVVQTSLEELSAEQARLMAENEEEQRRFEQERRRLELELAQAQGSLTALRQEVAQLERDRAALFGTFEKSRNEPMIYQKGEEVARLPVPASLSHADAVNALTRLLRTARIAAESRGAAGSDRFPSAGLMPRQAGNRIVSREELEASAISRIVGIGEETLVVATSTINAFRGEPVSLDLALFRNPIVFRQGELVAEANISPGSENEILDQITALLRGPVTERARQAGMIPVQGREAGFGEIEADVIVKLVQDIRGLNRRVRLQAIASRETRAGDQLRLDFRIR